MTGHRASRTLPWWGAAWALLPLTTWCAPASTVKASLPMLALEQAIETEASAVDVPTAIDGPLSVKTCASCSTERWATDGKTRYFARSSQITAAEWQALSRTVAHANVTILLDAHTRVVTRVLLDLAPPARRSP